MRDLLILSAIVSTTFASGFPPLLPRQMDGFVPCSQQPGQKACGSAVLCIPESYICCPDGSRGCPPTEYCSLGDNGQYGCCPNGHVCSGPGGVINSIGTSIISLTSTETVSQPAPPSATSTWTTPIPPLASSVAPTTSALSSAIATPSSTTSVATTSPTVSPTNPTISSSAVRNMTSGTTSVSVPHFTGGASTSQFAFSEISILTSLLIGLLPGFLR